MRARPGQCGGDRRAGGVLSALLASALHLAGGRVCEDAAVVGSYGVLIGIGAAVACGLMALLWLVRVRIRDASHVDVGWAGGLTILAVVYAVLAPGDPAHRTLAYPYVDSWLAQRFFSGGIMPSHDLLLHYQRDLVLLDRWTVDGTHYERTANAWLDNLDARRDDARAALGSEGGSRAAALQLANWRLFLMARAELWGYRGGREWLVSHYLFEPR